MPLRSLCLTQPLSPSGSQQRRLLAPQSPTKRTRQRQQARCEVPPTIAAAGGGAFPAPGEDSFASYEAPPNPIEQQPPAAEAGGNSSGGGGSGGAAAAPSGKSAGRLLAAAKGAGLAYDRAVKANPTLTKALTSLVGFAVGDAIAQSFTTATYDPFRYAPACAPAAACCCCRLASLQLSASVPASVRQTFAVLKLKLSLCCLPAGLRGCPSTVSSSMAPLATTGEPRRPVCDRGHTTAGDNVPQRPGGAAAGLALPTVPPPWVLSLLPPPAGTSFWTSTFSLMSPPATGRC